MIDPKWANIIGLVLDTIGAGILTYGVITPKKKAIALGVMRIAGDTDEENLKLPTVQDRLLQSRNAVVGLSFLVAGFIAQIYGSWPR